MNDSPRASKRRKLDSPSRLASSSPAKASSARKSGRLTSRTAAYTNGAQTTQHDKTTPMKSATRSSKSKVNSAGRTPRSTQENDVWDDIEGALGEAPIKSSASKPRAFTKTGLLSRKNKEDTASTGNDTDELHSTRSTPKRGRGRDVANRESAGRKSFRSLVNGFKHGAELEAEIQDELANEALTPSKRALDSAARGTSTRRRRGTADTNGATTPSKTASPKRPFARPRRQPTSEAEDELAIATPSRSRRRRSRFQEDATILETEDELERRIPPSASKAATARRRAHRVDHTSNRDEGAAEGSDEEQAEAGAEVDGDAMSVDGNSIVGSVLDPTEPSPFNKPTSAQKERRALPLLHGHLEPGRELDLLKTVVLERINGKRQAPLVGLDDEYKSVHELIEHTITAGEGNSMLVIGARGSGKTALVNKVLSEISKDNIEDYHVVRLNGFIHTDDKIALREIWRQLGKEMDLEEEGGGVGKNYADTLTTLLALLSHPSEQTGEVTDQVAKAVIFVMDEFDHFAQHPRQTLLYNLFDIAQSRKAPIAVLGLTTRIDVANGLEKRVKSRFSHRYVHLSLAKTFTAFQETCKSNLIVQPEQLSVEERAVLEGAVKTSSTKKGKKGAKTDVLTEWNSNINALFASSSFLTTHLAPHFYRTKSIPSVLNSFLLPTATLSSGLLLSSSNLVAPPDSKLVLVPSLSTLSLSLLIAAARLDIIHDSDTCNFNMAYDEYVTLASRARIQSAAGGLSASGSVSKVWGKEVARREWEGLVELGLVMPVVGGQTGGFSMVKVDVSLEEIGAVLAGEKGMDRGLERWCRHI